MDNPRPQLLGIDSMPGIPGLVIPDSFYLVTWQPVPVAGMRCPDQTTPWKELYRIGIQAVVCLTEAPPAYSPIPLCIAGHFPLQDLYGKQTPDQPEPERILVAKAVRCVWDLIDERVGVVIHCEGGTGRTGTVIGCLLKCLGYNSDQVIDYLDELNQSRGARNGWPESAWQAETIKQFHLPSD